MEGNKASFRKRRPSTIDGTLDVFDKRHGAATDVSAHKSQNIDVK